jgi:hypothetical protein
VKEIKPDAHSLTVPITNISLREWILYNTATYSKKGCPWPKCKYKYQPNHSSLDLQYKNYAIVTHSTIKTYIQMNARLKDLMWEQRVSDKICSEIVVRYMMNC